MPAEAARHRTTAPVTHATPVVDPTREHDCAGLHIGYLVQQFPPEIGAGPARVAEMSQRWLEAGARVTVFTAMPNRPQGRIYPQYRGKPWLQEDHNGIRVIRSWLFASPRHSFASTLLNNATFMFTSALSASLAGRGIDVLIASEPPFFPHLSGAFASGMRRTPLVLEVRDLWPDYIVEMNLARWRGAARALYALERALLQRADYVVAVTASFRRRIIEKGVRPDVVDVISNGVDTALYFPASDPPPIEPLRGRVQDFIVGYLGNIGAGQGLQSVLDAAALLAEQDASIRFVLAGDGPARAEIARRAEQMQLRNVDLHAPIAKQETRAFYNCCDVCLVPLAPVSVFQDTVPSKLFEIMACARPVVLSAEGEARRIVDEAGAGVHATPGSARELADALLRMRQAPPATRALMGERGRAYVQLHYERDVLARRYLQLLRRVAAQRVRANGAGRS